MKHALLISLVIATLMQSCAPGLSIPSDLRKSLLLVEKLPTDSVALNDKGKKEVVDRKVGGWASMLNRRANAKTEKVFKGYPFAYKMVTIDEVGDNIDPSKTTYFLKNGNSTRSQSVRVSSSGNPSVSTKVKTKVVLENLTKPRKSILGEVQGGVSGLSGSFVKAAVKLNKSGRSKKTNNSKKKS